MYKFSNFPAEVDGVALWSLQNFLLSEAEKLFGEKNSDKKIYQPTFKGERPRIINTPNLDGAFASLSNNARAYWPTTLYELAHETVHLLDPIVGFTNYLEEGFAVLFSVDMAQAYTDNPQSPKCPFYSEAWSLVSQLGASPYDAAKLIRERFGSLGAINIESMIELFPQTSKETIQKLCSECNFI